MERQFLSVILCFLLLYVQANANGLVYFFYGLSFDPPNEIVKPSFINRSDMFEKDHRSFWEYFGFYEHMSRQIGFLSHARDRSDDGCGAVPVSDIVLNNQNRTDTVLFATLCRA